MQPQNPIQAATHPDPVPYYRALVDERPLAFDPEISMWVAASAEAVTAVLGSDLVRVRPPAEPIPRPLVGTAAGEIFGRLVRQVDGPAHARIKPGIEAALRGVDLAAFKTRCASLAADLFASGGLSGYPYRLPAMAIGALLGLPDGRLKALAAGVGEFVRGLSPQAEPAQVALGAAAASSLRAEVRAHPGPVAARLSAAGLDADAAGANLVGFLSQAYEATAGLIGSTLLALARDPALRGQAEASPDQLHAIVLEVLRIDSPVQNTRRWLAADGEVGGQAMHAGDAILVVLAAANHDRSANPDPARFDPNRADPRLFTFGMGPHACPGRDLAAAIACAGVRAVLASGADLPTLCRGFSYQPAANVRIPVFRVEGSDAA